jgi:hypothetical protein
MAFEPRPIEEIDPAVVAASVTDERGIWMRARRDPYGSWWYEGDEWFPSEPRRVFPTAFNARGTLTYGVSASDWRRIYAG